MEMDAILAMNYNDMLQYAKDIGIKKYLHRPKKDFLIKIIQEFLKKEPVEKKVRKTRKVVDSNQLLDLNNNEVRPSAASANFNEEETEPVGKVKKVKKVTKVKKNEAPETGDKEPVDEAEVEEPPKKVKKVKKEVKTTLKNNETEEMKRIRRSIAEKKMAKAEKNPEIDELKLPGLKRLRSVDDGSDVVKVKRVKEVTFSDEPNLSVDASNKMKRRIPKKPRNYNKGWFKKKSLKNLDDEDSNENVVAETSPEPKQQSRRSVAFTINTTPIVAGVSAMPLTCPFRSASINQQPVSVKATTSQCQDNDQSATKFTRESFKPRTPPGARTINTLDSQSTPKAINKINPKIPVSTKPLSLLNSAKKPAVSKPFHFQNQNLESNINFGGACQFGSKNSLKGSAFQRRKSYNPRESIGRPPAYNPHHGKLSVKTASINGATEKRKSIFGLQRNMEKEKL